MNLSSVVIQINELPHTEIIIDDLAQIKALYLQSKFGIKTSLRSKSYKFAQINGRLKINIPDVEMKKHSIIRTRLKIGLQNQAAASSFKYLDGYSLFTLQNSLAMSKTSSAKCQAAMGLKNTIRTVSAELWRLGEEMDATLESTNNITLKDEIFKRMIE